ncbi:tyrosine-type recombinase/integrase [Verrucomicrobia bacterium]|nr:tyrosine-type recombinase/integrase [Verrucomicrobiota bacterium]
MKFPLTIFHRNHTAKIYAKSPRDGTYRTSWYAEGKRVQRNFKKLTDAKVASLAALKSIARGESNQASLTPSKIREVKLAENALRELGINLLDAVNEYVAAKKLTRNTSLETAVREWNKNEVEIKAISMELAASEYLKHRRGKIGEKTYREEELRLIRICRCLRLEVCDLKKSDLELFFDSELRSVKGKTRNHFRQTLRQLFKFAVRRDYLNKAHRLNEVLVNEPEQEAPPEILTPVEFINLLEASSHQILPIIAMAGMTGARRSELLRLTWEDVWRIDGFIELEAIKTKTKQRRLVPIQDSLVRWLAPYKGCKGLIWPLTKGSFHSQFQSLVKACGISGQNLLRHSYASYRLAQTQEPSKVAVEMGTGPEKLYQNYNKLCSPKQAEEWFSIAP